MYSSTLAPPAETWRQIKHKADKQCLVQKPCLVLTLSHGEEARLAFRVAFIFGRLPGDTE